MYVAHRLCGVALTVYLYVHLITLGSVLQGPDGFDRAMSLMDTATVKLLELFLIWVAAFHALNGLRLSVVAVAPSASQKRLAYMVVAVSLLVVLASWPFLWN